MAVRTGDVLHNVKEDRSILYKVKGRKAKWICHFLRTDFLLKHVTEGKIEGRTEVTGRRGRRHTQLLDGVKGRRGYCKLKDEELGRTLWRTRFAKGCRPGVKTEYGMNLNALVLYEVRRVSRENFDD
jgi:hypothetical protein